MLKPLALALIAVYQRHLSPRKGFGCPLRLERGGAGCSGFGKRAIARAGFFKGLLLLRRRLDQCVLASARASAAYRPAGSARGQFRALGRQGGFVDCACDSPGCDLPSCDAPSCDLFDGPSGKRCSPCSTLPWEWCGPDCSGSGSEKKRQAAASRQELRRQAREQKRSEREAQRVSLTKRR